VIHVRAPATTANLGAGFDCAGAALDLWNELELSEDGGDVDAGHLAVRAFARLASPDGFGFTFTERIPRARGLGSSAATIALGLVAGAEVAGRSPDAEELLALGLDLEGHPDNLAAALAGGVCLTWEGRVVRIADDAPGVPIAVVPREIVADICRELAMAGLRAGGIALMTGGHTDPIFLPPTVLTGLQEAAQPKGNRLLLAAIGGLAVVAAISWPMAQQARLSSIESELALLKPQAEAALRAREQQQREAERAASVSTLATGRLPLIRALDTLSREIPDGSWLLSLSISGRDVVLDGLSPSAATIAQALERSRAFSAIDFRSRT